MTIRRDLAALAERGVIERVHGGGVLRRELAPVVSEAADDAQRTRPAQREVVPARERIVSGQVGIVVPTGAYYFPQVVAGARRVFDARKVRRALAISNYQPAQDRMLARQLLDAGATGLLLTPNVTLDEGAPELLDWLFELPVPVVLMERTVQIPVRDRALCSVRADHELGAARAVRHLARLGHRGVALVTQGQSQTKSRVINGWRAAVATAGMDPAGSPLIITSPAANRCSEINHYSDVNHCSDAGYSAWPTNDAMAAVLQRLYHSQATAVLVHSDQTALSLVHHARGHGWRIPEDLSVIAYDDEIAEMADPPLTAVSPPKRWVGQGAAHLLLELMTDGIAGPVRHVVVEPELVVRASTLRPRTTSLPNPGSAAGTRCEGGGQREVLRHGDGEGPLA